MLFGAGVGVGVIVGRTDGVAMGDGVTVVTGVAVGTGVGVTVTGSKGVGVGEGDVQPPMSVASNVMTRQPASRQTVCEGFSPMCISGW